MPLRFASLSARPFGGVARLLWVLVLTPLGAMAIATGTPAQETSPSPTLSPNPSSRSSSDPSKLRKTAEDQYAEGQFSEALKTLQTLLAEQQKLRQPQQEAETLNLIGLVQDRLQQFEAASMSYQKALELYGNLKATQPDIAKQGEARTLNNLGTLYASTAKTPEALGFLERALGLFRELKNRESEAVTLRNLGNLYLRANRGEEAIAALEKSLALETELKRPVPMVEILDRLSTLYLSAGAPSQSLAALQQAYAIVEPTPDLETKLALLTRIGQLFESGGRPDKSVEAYQTALDLVLKASTDQIGEAKRPLEGRLRNRIAEVFADAGETERALAQYEKVLAIAQDLKDPFGQAQILTSIGDLQRRVQNLPAARDRYQQALTLIQPLKRPIAEGRLLSGLAVVAQEEGQVPEALKLAKQALAMQEQPTANEEEADLQRAGKAVTLSLLGDLYRTQNQYEPAAAAYQQALVALGPQGNLLLQGENLTHLGAMLMQLKKPEDAVKPLQQAIALWEAVGLESAQGGDRDPIEASYRLLTDAFLLQEQPDQALGVVEQGRSRLYRTLLDLRQPTQAPPIKSLSLEQIKQSVTEQKATALIYDLAQTEQASSRPSQPPSLNATTLRIWLIQSDGTVRFTPVALTPDQAKLLKTPPAVTREVLQQLAVLLLDPIAEQLPKSGKTPLLIQPLPSLQNLPWAALPLGQKPLLEYQAIAIIPSLQMLVQPTLAKTTTTSRGTALVVGNPQFPKGANHPVAAEEAEAIAQLLNTQALTGKAATLQAIAPALSQAKIIHLAVPELKVEDVGEALIFASEQELKGITPADILALNLQADLVTLHGLPGNLDQPAQAPMSIAQAFRAAGATTVIHDPGQASDEATRDILKGFYTNLKSGQTTAEALRQAMLAARNQYPNPQDWAGLALMGSFAQTIAMPQS